MLACVRQWRASTQMHFTQGHGDASNFSIIKASLWDHCYSLTVRTAEEIVFILMLSHTLATLFINNNNTGLCMFNRFKMHKLKRIRHLNWQSTSYITLGKYNISIFPITL